MIEAPLNSDFPPKRAILERMRAEPEPFARDYPEGPSVRGYWHAAEKPSNNALVLTHGAGSDCRAPLLVSLAEEFAEAGVATLRCDLPYRQSDDAQAVEARVEALDPYVVTDRPKPGRLDTDRVDRGDRYGAQRTGRELEQPAS